MPPTQETSGWRFAGAPRTDSGKWSVRLSLAFCVLFAAWLTYVGLRRIPRPTFFSDPLHAVLLLSAVLSAALGGLLGSWSVLFRGERSPLTFVGIILGGIVLWWAGAETLVPH